ncbi:polysaccharide biosynthesis tyrosine autokinase [Anaeromyxobacter paludicola]|uniref:Tyrosine kinase BceF n=1 Tax=Anaeromyxobacter paludicola TaxID=2918171 RepID=A0ABM7XCT2_9BACT|nr:polysaccharide biosynthesis tyrosine autokinase [Anaeromyxobacter paludicola]BDG09633.1 tyrosine kinase BceF [Anaeromyxobacter paludicola]
MTPSAPRDPSPIAVAPSTTSDSDEDEAGLAQYLGVLLASRGLILATTVAALLGGLLYTWLAAPVFRSDVLVQVEEKQKGVGALDELSGMLSTQTPADTEIEIIRSRSLVGAVVQELGLDVVAEPRHFPLVGAAIARHHRGEALAAPLLGLARYAWGGERIAVDRLAVSPRLENERLTLVAGEAGRYRLLTADGDLLVEGQVGQAAGTAGGPAQLFVSELRARPGTWFRLMKRPASEVVQKLQKDLVIAEKGKKTGIIRVELSSTDRERLVAILDAMATDYLRQNVERKSEEAQKTLEFVNAQLPVLRGKVEEAEQALNAYRSAHGTIDLSLEAKAALDRSVEIEKLVTELSLQRAELKQRFTDTHPYVVTIDKKLAEAEAERTHLVNQIKGLPQTELQSARLMRDVKVSNELYVLLLNKSQELKVAKSGTIGNVRILDRALVPRKPVHPEPVQTAGLAVVLGLVLGVVAAFVRRSLNRGVEDPDLVEAATGIGVYASVPHSDLQSQLGRGRKAAEGSGLLAVRDSTDLAIESLRSLRTSLQFALMDAPNRVIALGGPSPGIGKSFVATNLAAVLADAGERVLLIDGDMRNGRLHKVFGLERSPGLSEVIAGSVSFDEAVHRDVGPNLDLLPQGVLPPNPSELLMSAGYRKLVERVSAQYALVLIDTPPILAVTDAAIIGRTAGVNLLVLRAGQHPLREITLTLKRYGQSGIRPAGFVFNDVVRLAGRYGYGYGYGYGYHYQYDYKKRKSA